MTENTQQQPPAPQHPELPTQYAPAEVEGPLYERWVERGYFEADAKSDKPPYTIVIPPPNVTGSLHLGHAFEHTLMDALTRRKRMQGYETLWLPGMDHAGIATQNVVERELAKEGKSRHDLGREAFVERVWQWKDEYGGQILGQMRRLGDGVDWSRERFTMDEGLSRAVQTIFKRLYDDGLIYRAERIINWCPRCLTAHLRHRGRVPGRRRRAGLASATARATTPSSSPPPAPRRCSATPPSPSTPTTSATRTWSASEIKLPLTDRTHPGRRRRRTSTRSSAPARSR